MKILYKPFAIISSLIGAKLGHRVFDRVWQRFDESKPPKPTTAEASVQKVVAGAALEAATLAAVAAIVDRASAKVFAYFTGVWPGEHRQEPAEPESES